MELSSVFHFPLFKDSVLFSHFVLHPVDCPLPYTPEVYTKQNITHTKRKLLETKIKCKLKPQMKSQRRTLITVYIFFIDEQLELFLHGS